MESMLTVEEVADLLKVNATTVRRLAARGKIPALRIGRCWRIRPRIVRELIEGLAGTQAGATAALFESVDPGVSVNE